jgi:chromosome segregation ATPase
METATQAPVSGRPADKVLQALATLAALIDATIREVKSLDGEFQTRLLQAVHETEASLQAQTAEHVGRARQEVQLELDSKFQNDLQAALNSIKSEFESERERFSKDLLKASETASQLEAERSTLVEQVERVKADSAAELAKAQEDLNGKFQNELQSTIEGLKVEFEAERQKARENAMKAVQDAEGQLKAQAAEQVEHARVEVEERLHTKHKTDLQCALDALKGEFEVERGRLNEVASKLELQLAGLLTEVQQVKADSATEIENARAEAKAAAAAKQAAPAEPAAPPAALQKEIERSETKLQEILKLIDNPATELSTVIRKNVERSELEAYLKGIRLVLGATS